jgi:hypothetical protein
MRGVLLALGDVGDFVDAGSRVVLDSLKRLLDDKGVLVVQ